MNEIRYLKEHKSRLKFQVKVARYFREGKYEDSLFEKAIIVLTDSSNDKCRVHEFTEFIMKKYGKSTIKTQVDYAGKLVKFLNFVLYKKIKKSFKFLDFDDITIFLQTIALDVNYETMSRYKKVIVDFYWHLANKGWLNSIFANDFVIAEVDKKGVIIKQYDVPGLDIDINKNNPKGRNTHVMDYKLQAMFLQVVIEEVNRIAFGVALQMFGGLREGEIINLSHSGIQCIGPYGRYGMLLNLENRYLRQDLKGNQGKGYVKKQRKQQVISPYGILEDLYKSHIRKYRCNSDSGAVFVNKNGDPMTLESYSYYFRKLKKIFLQRLKECNNPSLKIEGDVLMAARWGTHIGRGIFTNNLAEFLTASELKIKRGDDWITSSEVYIEETKKIGKKYEENAEGAFKSVLKVLNIKGDNY
ncbi:hypothetical protein [Clostridium cibarium]|uniref:Phage integrase SAM-like domain-containing protein n=1 Tax=Clostridium cibarium TaxID=2762247 RepID=A0ABR8PYS0_9CLOT|nr:hypothetical protein [Clostridium cibarium]MBD7913318.1 hypothetical protein [Clostridium cibarium]